MSNPASRWNERYADPEYYYGVEANTFLAIQKICFLKTQKFFALLKARDVTLYSLQNLAATLPLWTLHKSV
jgi:hypothetical protein